MQYSSTYISWFCEDNLKRLPRGEQHVGDVRVDALGNDLRVGKQLVLNLGTSRSRLEFGPILDGIEILNHFQQSTHSRLPPVMGRFSILVGDETSIEKSRDGGHPCLSGRPDAVVLVFDTHSSDVSCKFYRLECRMLRVPGFLSLTTGSTESAVRFPCP